MRALLVSVFAVWVGASALAQNKVTLNFDKESPRVVFTSSEWPKGLPAQPELQSSASITYPLGSAKPDDYLVVWDRDLNNVAIRTVKGVKDSWKVDPTDYRYIGYVTVRVEHAGVPLSAAQVEITTKERTLANLIDPTAKGEARFFAVAPGEIRTTVRYRASSQDLSTKQGFEAQLTRQQVEPKFVVSIAEDASTITAPTVAPAPAKTSDAGKADSAPAKAPDSQRAPRGIQALTGPIGTVLLGLAVAFGAGYFLLQWINKNPGKLKDLGVAIPDGPPHPDGVTPNSAPAQAPAAPPEPQPIKQIILQDAAPTAAVAVAPVPVTTGVPRLVGDHGHAYDLAKGETLVGRDASLAIGLATESTVSKRHASLTNGNGHVVLKDLGSTNGTFVNGSRLQAEVVLRVGDTVQFGSVRFRYEA